MKFFKIAKILTTDPTSYKLQHFNRNKIKGDLYATEFRKGNNLILFFVRKILWKKELQERLE